jgi:hypothetical protein
LGIWLCEDSVDILGI